MATQRFSTLILDLGDVLFSWSANTTTSIPARTLKELLSSHIWHAYETSYIEQGECYRRLGEEFSLEPAEIATALNQARESLAPNEALVSLIEELRALHPHVRVYAMSNISVSIEIQAINPWSLTLSTGTRLSLSSSRTSGY
jgi:FMN phosphatase YigB (HAD superfamily)